MDKPEILKTLLQEVVEATEESYLANRKFLDLVKDVPSGLPHPDGVQRVMNASTEGAHAREKLRSARTRLEHFREHGFVPKDLR
jgi:hypothetical protein